MSGRLTTVRVTPKCTLPTSEDPDEMKQIILGSTLFAKTKSSSEKEIHFVIVDYNLTPHNIYNGPSQPRSQHHCIRLEGRIH